MATLKVQFEADTCKNMNIMLRAFDKTFRHNFNVYGGKRIKSCKARNSLYVEMWYTADVSFYKLLDMVHTANNVLCRNHEWTRNENMGFDYNEVE